MFKLGKTDGPQIPDVYNCFVPPSPTLSEFEEILDNFIFNPRGKSRNVFAGDLNAFVLEWGNREVNARGHNPLEASAQSNTFLANEGNIKTFRRGGSGSIAFLTFRSPALRSRIF